MRLAKLDLTWRLRWWFLGIALVPFVCLWSFVYVRADRVLRDNVAARLDSLADSKAEQFETFAAEELEDAQGLARSPELVAAVERLARNDDPSAIADLQNELRASLSASVAVNRYTDLFLVSPAGDELFAFAGQREPGTNYLTGPYRETQFARTFARTRSTQTPVVSAFAASVRRDRPGVLVAAPVLQAESLVGVLIVEISHDRIERMINQHAGLGETGEIVVGTLQGDTVTFLARTRHDPQAAHHRTIRVGDALGQSLQRATAGEQGSGVLLDYRGVETFSAWRHLPSSGWGLAVEIDTREVLAPLAHVLFRVLVLGGLAVAIVVLLAWYAARSLARPIVELTDAARRFAGGQLAERVVSERDDEIGELARAFNAMTDDLQRMHATLEDQVRQRTAELREQQARFQELAENIQEVFWIASPDTAENLYASPAYETVWGRTIASLRASPRSWLETIHADDRERVRETFAAAESAGVDAAPEAEFRIVRPDGAIRWIRSRGFPVLDEAGRLQRMAGVAEDVTDRKRADEEYQQFFKQSESLLLIAGVDGFIKKANPAYLTTIGYSAAELSTIPFIEFVHPQDRARTLNQIEHSLQCGSASDFDVRVCRPDGAVRQLSMNSTTSQDGSYFYVIGEDVTDRRQSEEALAESERFARSTLDALSAHIAILDERGLILATNRAWREFAVSNSAGDEVGVGANYLDVCDRAAGRYAVEAAAVADGIRQVIRGGRSDFKLEYPCHAPTERRWFLARVTRFEGDGPVRVVVSHENITAARLADEERQKFVSLVENSIDFIGMATLSGDLIYLNPAACQLVGFDPARIATGIKVGEFCTDDGRRVLEDVALPAVDATGWWDGEIQFRHFQTGQPIEMQESVFIVRHPTSGEPLCMATVARDVTQRMRQTEELRQARAQLIDAIESLDAGFVMYGPDERLVVCNSRYKEFFAEAADRVVPGASYAEPLPPAPEAA